MLIQYGRKKTFRIGKTPASLRYRRFAEPMLSTGLSFAFCCGLQQAQTLANDFFRVLIAFPLVFELQARPPIGIQGLQVRPPEGAIGDGLRHKQGMVGTANSCFRTYWRCRSRMDGFGSHFRLSRAGRAAGNRQRAPQRAEGRASGRELALFARTAWVWSHASDRRSECCKYAARGPPRGFSGIVAHHGLVDPRCVDEIGTLPNRTASLQTQTIAARGSITTAIRRSGE